MKITIDVTTFEPYELYQLLDYLEDLKEFGDFEEEEDFEDHDKCECFEIKFENKNHIEKLIQKIVDMIKNLENFEN